MPLVETIAPQMLAYREQFHTDNDVDWLPYLMFFHPKGYRSAVVSTDDEGFRFSRRRQEAYSVASASRLPSARLLAGNSVAFGIGASSDSATIASRLMSHDEREPPWLNFGGRAFNSTQELILITLYRHLLPKIEEIVLLSGANNLLLARLPEAYIREHGAFYNCGGFFSAREERSVKGRLSLFGKPKKTFPSDNDRSLEQRIAFAAELTLRHLDGWRAIANDLGAKFTYVLQPMSGWVRDKACKTEEALFGELAQLRRYTTISADILRAEVCARYSALLEAGARQKGISFVNLSPVLRARAGEEQWLFIDHTHLTDEGYDLAAQLILECTQ
jgi:hypothetical protein